MSHVVAAIENALDTGSSLVHLSPEPGLDVYASFKDYNTFTGKAVYRWDSGEGLVRLDVPHIHAPDTASFDKLLSHIGQSHHYGIYLLDGYGRQLEDPKIAQRLLTLSHAEQRERHVLVFLEPELHLHPLLIGHVVRRRLTQA